MDDPKVIYLDNNATSRVAPEVAEGMKPFFTELYGNPSSMHFFGGGVQRPLDEARQKVAALLGASPEEIIFTSCGTESDSTAIWSALRAYPEKKHLVTTAVEHPAVLNLCKFLETQGCRVTYLPVDGDGRLNLEDLKLAVSAETALVSIMWANNETGVVFPVEEAARIVHAKGALFHTDAVQAAGKLPINLKDTKIDMLSISGHKLHAPKGIGVLFLRKGARFSPFMMGGHQERGRRAGTENVPAIVGFGMACELASAEMPENAALMGRLQRRLMAELPKKIEHVYLNGHPQKRVPNNVNFSVEFVEGEGMMLLLDGKGISVSSGSACASKSLKMSHVLTAIKADPAIGQGSIIMSLSKHNGDEDVDYLLAEFPPIVKKLRDMSPIYNYFQKTGQRQKAGPGTDYEHEHN